MLNKLVVLRRQHLGAEVANALFAAQEAQDRFGIQIAGIDADQKLTAQEKLARLDVLQRSLPKDVPGLHAELDASRSALMMEQGVAALRQQGAPEAQVRQLRERHVGAEAAQNIGAMEVQKIDWEHRQQVFSQQKNAVAQMNLSEQQKQEKIEALLRQLYAEEEIPIARAFNQLPTRR
jgi:lipase chaperone LimK